MASTRFQAACAASASCAAWACHTRLSHFPSPRLSEAPHQASPAFPLCLCPLAACAVHQAATHLMEVLEKPHSFYSKVRRCTTRRPPPPPPAAAKRQALGLPQAAAHVWRACSAGYKRARPPPAAHCCTTRPRPPRIPRQVTDQFRQAEMAATLAEEKARQEAEIEALERQLAEQARAPGAACRTAWAPAATQRSRRRLRADGQPLQCADSPAPGILAQLAWAAAPTFPTPPSAGARAGAPGAQPGGVCRGR